MPFLRGSLGFERFTVAGFEEAIFAEEQIKILSKHAAGRSETTAIENVHTGFLGGDHLFDQDFNVNKNIVNDALHVSVRIDTNKIPAAIRKAWLQMEIAGIAKDSEDGIVSKAQRKEAKEAMEQRCEVEAATGKYRKMQSFPLLWDYHHETLYFGGSVGNAAGLCMELVESCFGVELSRIGAGAIATQWGIENDRYAEVDDLQPISFVDGKISSHHWSNEHSLAPDFLGNEFLMWLWWTLENEGDTIALPDGSSVTAMMAKTLTLECPHAESGKETITAECPIKLPEAMQAIRSGKLPRKAGMTVIRNDRQFDLTLNAETFGISGAKIHLEDDEDFDCNDRIDAIRLLGETTDLMLHAFCALRTSPDWNKERKSIQKWLTQGNTKRQKTAA
ncbi:MAG: hypothetical protein AB8B50_04115 [Pirellulaceae bacterium]